MCGATGLSTDRMMPEGAAVHMCRAKALADASSAMKNRYLMQLDLRSRLAQPAHAARNPRLDERERLAHLMLAAYRGAADDEGETIAEALQEVDSVLVSTGRPLQPLATDLPRCATESGDGVADRTYDRLTSSLPVGCPTSVTNRLRALPTGFRLC